MLQTLVLAAVQEPTASCGQDVGFGLMVAGLFGLWMGGGNVVARRVAARRWSPLGRERTFWWRRGVLFAPDWLSLPVFGAGFLLLLVGTLLQLLN